MQAAPTRAPVSRRPFIAAPPPPPPGGAAEVAAPRRIRRWWIEAVGAVVLIGLLALVFRPAAPPGPSGAEGWLASNGRTVGALMSDIAAVERGLAAGAAPLDHLERDLATAGQTPPPPGPGPQRAWSTALEQTGAAIGLLRSPAASPTGREAALGDLAAAADALVALTQAGHTSISIYPH